MNTTAFYKNVKRICSYIGCIDHPDGFIGSHEIVSDVLVRSVDPDDDKDYEIVGLSWTKLPGCGCECDLVIEIKALEGEG